MAGEIPERVDAETQSRLEHVASAVRDELAAAGLEVVAPGLAPDLAAGAEVEVDLMNDTAGGVFIHWRVSPRLRTCAINALRHKRTDDPALSHNGAVQAAMAKAVSLILTSAGFSVDDADDEYRTFGLKVTAGPGEGIRPSWAIRDDELTLPGWATQNHADQD